MTWATCRILEGFNITGVAQAGAITQLNSLTSVATPIVNTATPGSGVLGQYWINASSASVVKQWNGSTWVTAVLPYLALLTADPTGLTTIAALSECTDSGYARQQVTFSAATATAPVVISNADLLQFTFSVNMALPVQWLALLSVASGTSGVLLQTWTLSSQQQVLATQSISIAAGSLIITDS